MITTELVNEPTVDRGINEKHMKKDFTHLSLGERTNALLKTTPGLTEALSTFTSTTDLNSGEVTILIPGVILAPHTVFERQIKTLSSLGQDVVGLGYSDKRHAQDLLRAQLADFLSDPAIREKSITLMGVSLGAFAMIDLLANVDRKEIPNIRRLVILGAIYSDEDIKNGPFGKAFSVASKLTPEAVAERFVPLAKRFFRLDPMQTKGQKEASLRRQIANTSSQALVDRIKAIGQGKPMEEIEQIVDIDVLVGWWQDDYASAQARRRVEDLFPYRTEFLIEGHHSWTNSGATQINNALLRFFKKD